MRLIDADKLKEFILRDNILSRFFGLRENKRHIREMLSYIDFQPTVEAKPIRRGHWMHSDYNEFWGEEYRCSICGGLAPLDVAKTKFCPHCGAKMEDYE